MDESGQLPDPVEEVCIINISLVVGPKGQLISKQNCRAVTSSKKQTKDFCPGRLILQG